MPKKVNHQQSKPNILHHIESALNVSNYQKARELAGKIQADKPDSFTQAHIYLLYSRLFREQGDYGKAKRHLSTALKLAKSLKDETLLNSVFFELGRVLDHEGNYEKAVEHFRRSLGFFQKQGAPIGEMHAYYRLAYVASYRGDYSQAHEYFDEAIVRAQSAKDEYALAHTLHALSRLHSGNFHDFSGVEVAGKQEVKKAFGYLKQAMSIARKLNDQRGIAHALAMMGFILLREGKLDDAQKTYQESLKLSQKLGLKLNEARLYYEIGKLAAKKGSADEAFAHLKKALSLAKKLPDKTGLVRIYYELGYLNKEKKTAARKFWKLALRIAQSIGDQKAAETIKTQIAL